MKSSTSAIVLKAAHAIDPDQGTGGNKDIALENPVEGLPLGVEAITWRTSSRRPSRPLTAVVSVLA